MALSEDKIRVFENGLQKMLSEDIDLSARSCVREGLVMNASDITRIPARMNLLLQYSLKQKEKRKQNRDKVRIGELEGELKLARQTINTLTEHNKILAASHRAMLLVVGEYGGIKAWQDCFSKYESSMKTINSYTRSS